MYTEQLDEIIKNYKLLVCLKHFRIFKSDTISLVLNVIQNAFLKFQAMVYSVIGLIKRLSLIRFYLV